jgi:hypothetical protein
MSIFEPKEGGSGAFGSGYSDPIGGLGEHSYNPNTGEPNSAIGKAWSGLTGKRGPTEPRLPRGFEWMGDFSKQLAMGAPLNYDASTAAQGAGVAGANALGATATGTLPGTGAAWNAGLGGLGQGISTGFLPNLEAIDAILRPGLERSFERGSAALRDQSALTGNLSSSGANRELSDFRGGLENSLNTSVAGVYGNALPTSMNIQSDLTKTGLGMPAMNAAGIYGPAAGQGLQGQQNVMQAIQTAMSAISGAPFSANQGTSGNSGAAAAGLMKMFAK